MPYANKEDKKAQAKKYYLANKEKLIADATKWLSDKKKDSEFVQQHREKTRARYHERKHDPEFIASKKKSSIKAMLKIKYGMSEEDYWSRYIWQEGKCAICGKSPAKGITGSERTLAVDHCHNTNKVRGLLCGQCNIMLGMAKDDRSILTKAIEYLDMA